MTRRRFFKNFQKILGLFPKGIPEGYRMSEGIQVGLTKKVFKIISGKTSGKLWRKF